MLLRLDLAGAWKIDVVIWARLLKGFSTFASIRLSVLDARAWFRHLLTIDIPLKHGNAGGLAQIWKRASEAFESAWCLDEFVVVIDVV